MGLDEHDTGKSCKLDEKAMSDMQTLLAESLDMERGSSKEQTGKEHLERADFILAKQKQEAEQVKAEKEAAEADRDAAIRETDNAKSEHEKLQIGNEEKQRRSAELDSEIAEKEERAREVDRENTDSISPASPTFSAKASTQHRAGERETEARMSISKNLSPMPSGKRWRNGRRH